MALHSSREAAFLALFERFAPAGVPATYLLALATRESGLDPGRVNRVSNATGLFQLTKIVIDTYNARLGTAHSLADVVAPELATAIATWHIAGILKTLGKHPATRPDMRSRRFVEILTLAWNAGPNAVAHIIGLLEAHGIATDRITVDTIRQTADATSASPYVADPRRIEWSKSVADVYLGMRSRPIVASATDGSAAAVVLGLAALGLTAGAVAAGRGHGGGTPES